jgi:hypothetical protein
MTAYDLAGESDSKDFLRRTALCSVARQNGKSLLVQAVIGTWLTTIALDRGKPQLVISVAHKLDLATALFKSLAPILVEHYGAKVSWSYGRSSCDMPDGSQWIVRAATPQAGHGYSADLVVIDEVWSVSEAAIDEGLIPSQTARRNSLLAMFSTAGTQESKAMLRWRDQGLQQIDAGEPGPLYFAEFSPPNDLDPMSQTAWEFSNPALGYTLELRTLEAMSKAPNRQAFLRASVNLWVSALSGWLEPGLFAACAIDDPPPPGGVLAVEQDLDQGRYCGVRANQHPNGKTVVTVAFIVDNMAALWAAVEQQIKDNPELRLAIVPGLEVHCPPKYERRRTIWGYKELLRWTQPVRSMIIENRLAHTGELQLIEHCERAVMVKHQGSIALSSARSPGPIELARCMVVAAALSSRPSGGGKPMLIVTKR